jgi:hypothetical protein
LDCFFLENVTRDDQVLTCIDVSRVDQATILRAIEAMKSGPVNSNWANEVSAMHRTGFKRCAGAKRTLANTALRDQTR